MRPDERMGPGSGRLFLLLTGCLLLCSSGCMQIYHLQGRVVEGVAPGIRVVGRKDPALMNAPGQGVAGAVVSGVLDPDSLRPRPLASVATDAKGWFSLPIDALGAGSLIYDVRLLVRREGNRFEEQTFRVPGRNRRVLVTLVPGEDTYRVRPGILEETLKLSEPYLDR